MWAACLTKRLRENESGTGHAPLIVRSLFAGASSSQRHRSAWTTPPPSAGPAGRRCCHCHGAALAPGGRRAPDLRRARPRDPPRRGDGPCRRDAAGRAAPSRCRAGQSRTQPSEGAAGRRPGAVGHLVGTGGRRPRPSRSGGRAPGGTRGQLHQPRDLAGQNPRTAELRVPDQRMCGPSAHRPH